MRKKLVSILIPSHKRQQLLKRTIYYFLNPKFNFCYFKIMDSSPKPLNLTLPKNFEYHHYKENKFVKKILNGVNRINTKYTVIVNDDDFLGFNALKRGISFLEKNKKYIAYNGEYISFRFLNKINRVIYSGAYLDTIKYNLNFKDKDKISRIKKMYLNRPHWYNALHRTETLKLCLNIAKLGKDIHFYEILIPFILGISGKTKVDNSFWYAKDANVYTDVKVRGQFKRKKMAEEILRKNSIIKKRLIKLMRENKIYGNDKNLKLLVDNIFLSYFEKYVFEKKKMKNSILIQKNIQYLKNLLPDIFLNYLRINVNYIKNGNHEDTNSNLKKYGPRKNKKTLSDWTDMKLTILKFIDFSKIYKNVLD